MSKRRPRVPGTPAKPSATVLSLRWLADALCNGGRSATSDTPLTCAVCGEMCEDDPKTMVRLCVPEGVDETARDLSFADQCRLGYSIEALCVDCQKAST